MGREYCLNIAHRWKLIGVDRIGPKIYLKLPKHGGNGGNGRYTEMRSYLRERRNHTMSVSEVRGENYGGNETRRRGGRLIAVKLHLLRWTRQREREREIERGREEEERKTERERERERNDGRERQRGPSGEAPPSAGVCICARWRRSVGVCRGCTHFAHRSNQRANQRCWPATFRPEQRSSPSSSSSSSSSSSTTRDSRMAGGRKRNMAKKGQDLTYKRDRKQKR